MPRRGEDQTYLATAVANRAGVDGIIASAVLFIIIPIMSLVHVALIIIVIGMIFAPTYYFCFHYNAHSYSSDLFHLPNRS